MYTVLIADDETIERNYLKGVIKKYPQQFFLVGEATNGDQVIEMGLDRKPNIIIMDINMPLCDGLIAAKIIKKKLDNTIIILNSAYAEFEFARQAINYNLDAYLLKPASEDDILETINSCLHKKRLEGKITGDFSNISNTINHEYPYLVIDRLIIAISTHDLELIQFNTITYLDFLKSQQNHLEEYRLYIINTMFSIMRALKKNLPENILALFNCDQHLQKISKAEYWQEILTLTEDFFKRIILLFSEDLSISPNCADMIKKYIDENFHKEISLDMLSDIFHFSPAYISRIFHQNKGITINAYLRQQRVNHAIYLLESSSLAIKDISRSCGFTNVSNFNRVFKEITGKTPSQIKIGGNIEDGD